jgi:hypothetical protein
MTHTEVAELLSLTGHELRAPAGVLGGYLALIEKRVEALSPDHQKALAGARRAQQRLVDLLDEIRSVAAIWHADGGVGPRARTPLATVTELLATGATDVVVETASPAPPLPGEVALGRDQLRVVVDTLAQVVVREYGGVVRCRVWRDHAWGHVDATSTTTTADVLPRAPFSRYRGGLGLSLVRAFALVEGAGGHIDELDVDGTPRGVRATLPIL